ncbi:hypothetical protein RI056_03580 [Komagataeibacter nataicola]|uniref:hypothetical protein n=1 Tax=Komagataeibacter nataicola TaxID=265960 RepID=UPI0028A6CBB1|nr:hypothetical protein [Komagataeibacter nataicola]WNM09129.1 hypothetical protein RI056_03580 [Komagataeibacter nataicola]
MLSDERSQLKLLRGSKRGREQAANSKEQAGQSERPLLGHTVGGAHHYGCRKMLLGPPMNDRYSLSPSRNLPDFKRPNLLLQEYERATLANVRFWNDRTFELPSPIGRFVPEFVYRGSLDNVGFRAMATAAWVSDMRRILSVRYKEFISRFLLFDTKQK